MSDEIQQINDHLVLICGKSATGKSTCLMNLENVLYLNCEAGKKLPFKPKKFIEKTITDPYQVYEAFEWAEQENDIKYIVIDGLNFLMDMFESEYIIGSANTMKGWSDYAQFFKRLMQQYVSKSSKNIIFTAHTKSDLNKEEMVTETKVPIKGSLANQGIEAFFSTIVSTKKVPITELTQENDLLNITDREQALGFKYVFQTQITKDTVNERMRSAMGLFSDAETFIDNDAKLLMERLREYYN